MTVTLRVATFNLRNSSAPDGPNAWPLRREAALEAIRLLDADVIGLQEVLADQLADLRSAFPGYTVLTAGRDNGHDEGEHATVLVRPGDWSVESAETRWLSASPDLPGSIGWDAELPRIATLVRLRHRDGTTADVANTHFDHAGDQARLESARLLDGWLRNDPDHPWILLGDLNAEPGSPPYRLLIDAGWRDPLPQATTGTFHDFTGATDCPRIDHILHTPAWHPTATRISTATPHNRLPSDHWPLTTTFTR